MQSPLRLLKERVCIGIRLIGFSLLVLFTNSAGLQAQTASTKPVQIALVASIIEVPESTLNDPDLSKYVIRPPSMPPVIPRAPPLGGKALPANSTPIVRFDALPLLMQKTGTRLLDTPKATLNSGESGDLNATEDVLYPHIFMEKRSKASQSPTVPVAPGTTQEFATQKIGVELQATPTVSTDGHTITLVLRHRIMTFEGYVEFGGQSVSIMAGGGRIIALRRRCGRPPLAGKRRQTCCALMAVLLAGWDGWRWARAQSRACGIAAGNWQCSRIVLRGKTVAACRLLPMMKRTLTPELLDAMPPDDPAARHSRRDLRVFNAVLGNTRWFRRTLPPLVRPGERVLEIGAGTGELGLSLLRAGLRVDGLDRAPSPAGSAWPAGARWHQADALAFDRWGEYEIVIGNLIFHHFDAVDLRKLGQQITEHTRVIVAGELKRGRTFQWLFAGLCRLVRANAVSRHDGRVSIAAGFCRDELPELLGLDPAIWHWQVTTTLFGTYRLVAQRRE